MGIVGRSRAVSRDCLREVALLYLLTLTIERVSRGDRGKDAGHEVGCEIYCFENGLSVFRILRSLVSMFVYSAPWLFVNLIGRAVTSVLTAM